MRRSPFLKGIVLLTLFSWALFPLACGNNNSPASPGGPAPTNTVAATSTPTNSPFFTYTRTATGTPTSTPPPSSTTTPPRTPTFTATFTPTNTSTPSASSTPTGTPTVTPTPDIVWNSAVLDRLTYFSNAPFQGANLNLQVNGQAVTDATVYLAGGGLSTPVTLVYGAPQTVNGQVYGQYAASLPSYQVGGVYTLTSVTSAGTASASVTAPGGNILIAPDGSQVSWSVNGSFDFAQVYSGPNLGGTGLYISPGDITSPFNVPATVFSGPGTYSVLVHVENDTSPVSGTTSGSLNAYDLSAQNVTIVGSPTNTPTPAIPTNTSTSTATKTFTRTPTQTFTPTVTWTHTCVANKFGGGYGTLSYAPLARNLLAASPYTLADTAVVTGIEFVGFQGPATSCVGGIYSQAFNGTTYYPGTLLAQTALGGIGAGTSYAALTAPVTLSPGPYWLAIWVASNYIAAADATQTSNTEVWIDWTGGYPLPTTFGVPSPGNSQVGGLVIYAEYSCHN